MHASYTQPNQSAGKTTPLVTEKASPYARYVRIMNRLGRRKPGGVALLLGAMLLLVTAFAYADVPVATISGPVSVAEGQTDGAMYTVTLEGGTGSEDIVFDYTITGTVSEADYTATVDGKLTLTATVDGTGTPTTGTITIQIPDDGIDEVAETLIVTLTKVTTAAGIVAIGSPNSVTTTVLPAATNILEFNTASRSVPRAEDTGLPFTATLTTDVNVVVHYDITPGTASRTDYDTASGTFTILFDDNMGSFTITPVDDNLDEDSETFIARLRLVSPPANVALGIATATGTITDNDTVAATITANQTTIVEGSVATFTVDLGVAGSEDVVVIYNTEPDADSSDFEAPVGTLMIPAGQTMGTIAITTSRDDIVEEIENLRVTLDAAASGVAPVNNGLAAQNTAATIKIGDPDSTVLVSVADATTTEGEDATLIVRLSGKVSAGVTIPYMLGGGAGDTATSGADYMPPSPPLQVEIEEGMTTGTITVPAVDDGDAEDTETLTLTLQAPTGVPEGVDVALGDAKATVTIRDDNPLTVTVEGANRFRQGFNATFTVKVNGGDSISDIEVDYTVGGTATKGTDYDEPDGTATILTTDPAETTISFKTYQDTEADETLVVTLTGVRTAKGRVTLGTTRVARATLVSQDTVIISVADATVTEGASASFVVSVDGAGSGTPKLRYETASGTATAADFTAVSDTQDIDIGADPTNTAITVAITNDSLAEGEETFTLNLSLENAPDNVVLAATSAKATISDDTGPTGDDLSVSVASEEGSVKEGSDANFPVTLTGTSTADVVVKYAVAGINPDGPKEAAGRRTTRFPATV